MVGASGQRSLASASFSWRTFIYLLPRKPHSALWVSRAINFWSADGAMPVALATMGIWTVASSGVMSGSSPLPEVVTRSAVGSTPSLCQYCMSSLVYLSRTLERGPRLVAPDSPATPLATRGLSPPDWVLEAA